MDIFNGLKKDWRGLDAKLVIIVHSPLSVLLISEVSLSNYYLDLPFMHEDR